MTTILFKAKNERGPEMIIFTPNHACCSFDFSVGHQDISSVTLFRRLLSFSVVLGKTEYLKLNKHLFTAILLGKHTIMVTPLKVTRIRDRI